jgi:hypothetical protein
VPADQPRLEGQEIPLGRGCGQDLRSVDPQAVEDNRDFVHERDVDVALRVLEDLGRFGDLDRRGATDAGGDDAAVEGRELVGRRARIAGDDLFHAAQVVHRVAGVDALR